MPITHSFNIALTGAAVSLTGALAATSDQEEHTAIELTSSAADVEATIAFAVADLKSFYYLCDQNTILKTNSSSAANDTFNIPANSPFVWNNKMLLDNPFGTDVTKVYVTNSSAVTTTAQVVIGRDGTPGA